MPYNYVTLAQLRAQLLARLQDDAGVNVTAAEANYYITEALRCVNALTFQWNADYVLNFSAGDRWKSLNVPGSPRQRTVTDSYLYSQMEAMLMEPMSGSVWTGTSQYDIAMLSAALQYRRDELLLQSGANTQNIFQPSPVAAQRSILADSTLDLYRVRWVCVVDSSQTAPYALGREDTVTRDAFGPLLSTQTGEPASWMITANTPLQFDVSQPPYAPGTFDMLVAYAGVPFSPPAVNLVGIPDDWTPALIYGALADVLSNSPDGRDASRAKYCLSRYEQLKKAMLTLPWLIRAQVTNLSVDTPGFLAMDSQLQNWEQRQNITDPTIVVGGVDLVALAPFVVTNGPLVSSVITVVGNAPVTVVDTQPIQLSKDGVDAVLGYAQHVATFKLGGEDFALTLPLYEQFEAYCRTKNAQYAALGIYRPDLLGNGSRNDAEDPRFIKESK